MQLCSLYPFPSISSTLLRLFWETQQASCNGTHEWGCALLDKLDYMCNLNGLQVLSHAKVAARLLRKSKIAEKSFRVYKERVMVCGYHMQNHSTVVILSSTPVVTFI